MGERVDGPDFICAGQQKAGTTWLYDQLAGHPSFWMPPIKELHYFDRGLRPGTGAVERGQSERPRTADEPASDNLDERDAAFIRKAKQAQGTYDFDLYRSLFAGKGDLLSGDITPDYSKLQRRAIDRIAIGLPETRFILLIRDPVDRLWSMLRMMVARERNDAAIAADWTRLEALLDRRGVKKRSHATELWRNWVEAAGRERVNYFFFDDIAKTPEQVLAKIVAHLGGDTAQPSIVPLTHNRHVFDVELPMDDEVRKRLVEHFAEELIAGATVFGGHAAEWPKKYGL